MDQEEGKAFDGKRMKPRLGNAIVVLYEFPYKSRFHETECFSFTKKIH
jgi:hypothetical protein